MSADDRFLALLRGINVGGNNIIGKNDLKACFEDMGFTNVRTYIQSGNILFRSAVSDETKLTEVIEKALSKCFSYDAKAVVFSFANYKKAVASAPGQWGHQDDWKHNALFIMGSQSASDFIKSLPDPKPDIEMVTPGRRVIFWSAAKAHYSKAAYMKLPGDPAYKKVTIRNHNTTFKLLDLFDEI